jgi:hypothetical protein
VKREVGAAEVAGTESVSAETMKTWCRSGEAVGTTQPARLCDWQDELAAVELLASARVVMAADRQRLNRRASLLVSDGDAPEKVTRRPTVWHSGSLRQGKVAASLKLCSIAFERVTNLVVRRYLFLKSVDETV